MENPFVKLVREGEESPEEDYTRLTPSAESMTFDEKRKRIAELREWKSQVEAGRGMDAVPSDAEQIDKIDEEIRKLEQE